MSILYILFLFYSFLCVISTYFKILEAACHYFSIKAVALPIANMVDSPFFFIWLFHYFTTQVLNVLQEGKNNLKKKKKPQKELHHFSLELHLSLQMSLSFFSNCLFSYGRIVPVRELHSHFIFKRLREGLKGGVLQYFIICEERAKYKLINILHLRSN